VMSNNSDAFMPVMTKGSGHCAACAGAGRKTAATASAALRHQTLPRKQGQDRRGAAKYQP
jgi:hypothetical protein